MRWAQLAALLALGAALPANGAALRYKAAFPGGGMFSSVKGASKSGLSSSVKALAKTSAASLPAAKTPALSAADSTASEPGRPDCSGRGLKAGDGSCLCKPGYAGADCSRSLAASKFIASDCMNLTAAENAACYRVTHGGPCSSYKLAWAPLCRRTCVAMQGQSCSVESRIAFCGRAPECEPLCHSLYETTCIALQRRQARVPLQRPEPTISWSLPKDPLSAFKDEFKAEVEGRKSFSALEPRDPAQASAESDRPIMAQMEDAVQDLVKRKVVDLPAVQRARKALLKFGLEDPDSCRARTDADCGDSCIWTDPLGEGPSCLPRLKSTSASAFVLRQLNGAAPDAGPSKWVEEFNRAQDYFAE